ncbi:MAG: Spy/CpxP family protein refolding chaperone [Polaromonas sp.]|nr:Spy/CpxP family protein refolding chaperone [Polaromonas sp.]
MKFSLKPRASLNSLLFAGLLAAAGATAMAQGTPAAPTAGPAAAGMPAGRSGDRMMGHRDPAKMQAWIAKRQADLKATLKITPAQEGAWTAFTASMQPPARSAFQTPEQRAEFAKLSTPERIDKMRALRTQRMAERSAAMDQRGEATKAFYAALSAEQQKTFDAEHAKFGQRDGRGHHQGGMHRRG